MPSRCLLYQCVRQKAALKIAIFCISDWLGSVTAWCVWMGLLAGRKEKKETANQSAEQ